MKLLSINTIVVLALAGMLLIPGAILGSSAAPVEETLFDNSAASVGLSAADGPNGKYVETTDSDEFALNFSNVNPDSTTVAEKTFNVTNTNTEPVRFWVSHDGGDNVTFRDSETEQAIETNASGVDLQPGEVLTVDVVIDTQGADAGEALLTTFTVNAGFTDETSSGDETLDDDGTPDGDGTSGGDDEGQPEGEEESDSPEDGVEVELGDGAVDSEDGNQGEVEVTPLSNDDLDTIDAQATQSAPEAEITVEAAVESKTGVELNGETEGDAETDAETRVNAETDAESETDAEFTGGGETVIQKTAAKSQVEGSSVVVPADQEVNISGEESTLSTTDSITERTQITSAVDIDPPAGQEDDSATIQLEVDRDAFEANTPETGQIGHWTGDGWQLFSTDVVERTDDSVVLEAQTDSFSPFAVFSDPNVEYRWTLPDGTTTSGLGAAYQFDKPGKYSAELTVEGASSRQDSDSLQFIADDIPEASIRVTREERVANTTLIADVDNTVGSTTVTWTFPDGTQTTGTRVSRDLSEGQHDITVQVEDEYGASSTTQRTIGVGAKANLILTAQGGGPFVLLSLLSVVLARGGVRFSRAVSWRAVGHQLRQGLEVRGLGQPVVDVGNSCLRLSSLSVSSKGAELTSVTIELGTADGRTIVGKEIIPTEPHEYAASSVELPLMPDMTLHADETYVLVVTATDENDRSDQLQSREFTVSRETGVSTPVIASETESFRDGSDGAART